MRKVWQKRPYLYLLLFSLLTFLILSLVINRFQVKKVIIVSVTGELNGLSLFNGKNLLFLDEQEIIGQLQTKNIQLKKIVIQKKFPDKIALYLTWRIPVARVITPGTPFYIDSEGFPAFLFADPSSFPEIHVFRYVYETT